MARTRWRWLAVAMLAVVPAGCSDGGGCKEHATSTFDPQTHPYPTARAAVDAFMASILPPETLIPDGAKFIFDHTVPKTNSSLEVAVFRERGGPGQLSVQHDGGWAVSAFETCVDS